MAAILLPVFFIAIATFALSAIVDTYRRYGYQALALQARMKRGNAAVQCRWIVVEPAYLQPAAARLREHSPRPAQPAVRSARRAAA